MITPLFTQWIIRDSKAQEHVFNGNIGIVDMSLKFIKIQAKSIGDKNAKYDEKFPIY
jgi:hypothetical protein